MMMISAIAASLLCFSAARAQDDEPDPRIDSKTGRQVAVWAPARHFDHIAMRLELDIPTMSEAKLLGIEHLTVAAVGEARSTLVLDCNGPIVSSVSFGRSACVFRQENKKLYIDLSQPLAPSQKADFEIRYSLDFSKNKGEGLTYSKAVASAESLTRQSPQIHAQGEAQLNSKWFPCHDFPNEKLKTEIVLTVEKGFDVVSNGHVASCVDATLGSDGKPRVTWDWVQDKPHSAYLVTLVVGKFATIELGGAESSRPHLPIPVYTPWGTETDVKKLYAGTPAMIAFFEERFRTKYPWDKYAQCIVRDFVAGGMENTSCTLMTMGSTTGGPGSQDDLISHELAHQWFGDLVTCKTWAHIWLNEGWASYCEALWKEHVGGEESPEKALSMYQRSVRGFYQSQRRRNKTYWPHDPAMVSNRYSDPDSVFTKPEDPYSKGAMVLHMLRQRVGDEAFFAATHVYLEKFGFGCADTDDFRREMEAASGQSLERFFDQWALRPGLPRLAVELEWDEAKKVLTAHVEQTQTIDANNPAYVFTLPLRVKFEDGAVTWFELDVDARTNTATYDLREKPKQVTVDPGMSIIAPSEIRKDLAWWIDESRNAPSYAALAAATEALSTIRDEGEGADAMAATMALARLAADPSTSPELVETARARTSTLAGASR
jgi:aminopeptidase N